MKHGFGILDARKWKDELNDFRTWWIAAIGIRVGYFHNLQFVRLIYISKVTDV